MTLSPDTITLCLDLLSGVSVPVTLPDAEAKMRSLVAARRELLAELELKTNVAKGDQMTSSADMT